MEKNIKIAKRGSPYKYESSLKRKILQELYSGTITRSDLCRKYHLGGNSTIVGFERWYEDDQRQMLSSTPRQRNLPNPIYFTFSNKITELFLVAKEITINFVTELLR